MLAAPTPRCKGLQHEDKALKDPAATRQHGSVVTFSSDVPVLHPVPTGDILMIHRLDQSCLQLTTSQSTLFRFIALAAQTRCRRPPSSFKSRKNSCIPTTANERLTSKKFLPRSFVRLFEGSAGRVALCSRHSHLVTPQVSQARHSQVAKKKCRRVSLKILDSPQCKARS